MNKIISILLTIILVFGSFVTCVTSENIMKTNSYEKIHEDYDMVIISPIIFSSTLQTLIDHKNDRNFYTFLKTTEDIYNEYTGRDKPEQIKYFIKDAIESWNISYVLLVGGAAQIPGRYTHIYFDYDYQDEWIFLSELYYADIYDSNGSFSSWDSNGNNIFGEYKWNGKTDTLDLYPDVYVGRLACINENELNTCIEKIITYENNEAYKQDWFTNLVVIGGDSLLGDEEHIDEGEYVNQAVIEILDGFTPKKIWASNGKLYQASNINEAINEGAGFVFFNGHGDLQLWATHPHESSTWIPYGFYQNSHINALTNENKLPIVISDACYHCTYNVASDCFGWNFVKNPTGGSIAYLGGTDIDVSYGGEDIITKGIEKLCLIISDNYKQGDYTFGELWGNAITDYISSSEMDEIDYITVEEFQPFGDPSLQIASKSQPPLKPEKPQGPVTNKKGEECTYNSSTTDPDGDNIYYMFDWGDGTYSEWLGPYVSGEKVSTSHIWSKKGTYLIRVIAKDEHGVLSNWSDSLEITTPKHKGSVNSFSFQHLLNRLIESFHLLKQILNSRPFLNRFFELNK